MITLPPNAQPLLPNAFARRFPLPFEGLLGHVAKQLDIPVQAARAQLFLASVPSASLQLLQLAVVDDKQPSVFTQRYAALTEDQVKFCDAVVSYFDTTGQYITETGVFTGPELRTVQGYADALRADAKDLVGKLTVSSRKLAAQSAELDRLIHAPADDPKAVDLQQKTKAAMEESQKLRGSAQLLLQDADNLAGLAHLSPELTERLASVLAKVQLQVGKFLEFFADAKRQVPTLTTEQHVITICEEFERSYGVVDLLREVEAHPLAEGLEIEHSLSLVYTAAFIPISVTELMDRFLNWKKESPGAHADDFVATLIPQERLAECSEGYDRFRRFLDRIRGMRPDLARDLMADDGDLTFDEWLEESYPDAFKRIAAEANVSRRIVEEIIRRWDMAGVWKFFRKRGKPVAAVVQEPELLSRSEREVWRLLRDSGHFRQVMSLDELDEAIDAPRAASPAVKALQEAGYLKGERPGEHTYMRAIEAQYGALTDMIEAGNKARAGGRTTYRGISIEELFDIDIFALRRSETFCWFEEPILAVEAASVTLPDTVQLSRDMTEYYSGWWYFTLPQPWQTLPKEEDRPVQALLWSWGDQAVYFSVYVDHGNGRLLPTTKFHWDESESLKDALARCRVEHQRRYTPEQRAEMPHLTGEDETLEAVERLMRFFAAGCLWIQQTILTQTEGHIERHARKRMEKKSFQRPLSDVQIIQLRRQESLPVPRPESAGGNPVDWKCRWIVGGATGFWRDQYYPSKGIHQPKWIAPYIKGPADKPLKVPTHRVYAVTR